MSSQHFRVYQGVNAHLGKEGLQVLCQVFIVVDTCYRFLGTQSVSNGAGIHIAALIGCDTYKEIGFLHTGFLQYADTGGRALYGHDVELTVQTA